MTFAQYFDYHSSLKPKWKDYYVSFKELRKQVQALKKLLNQCPNVDYEALMDMVRPLYELKRESAMGTDNSTTNQQQQTIPPAPPASTDSTSLLISSGGVAPSARNLDIQLCAHTFFDMLASDIQTAHNYYNESIVEEETALKFLEQKVREENWVTRRVVASKAKRNLQNEMVAVYRKLEFLYSFLHVNRLAISDLVRKYADLIPEKEIIHRLPPNKSLYTVLHDEYLSPKVFCDSSLVKELMEHVENLYATVFCANDHHNAISSLRQPHDQHKHSDTFKFAFNVGIIVPVIIMSIVLWFKDPATVNIKGFFGVLPVFRGTLLYILYTWLWGVNLYIYRQKRINHVFIFEFDPNNSLNHVKMFKTASVLTVIWVFYFFLYLGAAKGSINLIPIDVKYYPLALALTLILIVVFPFHMFHLGSRITLLKVMGNLLITPFGRADFRECFVADILTSMVIPITDTMYMFCYFFSNTWFNAPYDNHNKCHDINRYAGPCLTFLPYAWRLGQCLKKFYETRVVSHLMNGLKYCSAMTVIVLNTLHVNLEEERGWGPFRYMWLVAVIFSTLFSFSWDIQMDWGLLNFGKPPKSRPHVSEKVKEGAHLLARSSSSPSLSSDHESSRLLSGNNQYGTGDTSNNFSSNSSTTSSNDYQSDILSADHPIAIQESHSAVSRRRRHKKKTKRTVTWRNTFKPRLRERRFFSNLTYYLMSIFNFIARFAWAGTISTFFEERKDFLKILFGSMELIRRCSWSVLRLEWAVVSNSEGYRKHTTVPLPLGK